MFDFGIYVLLENLDVLEIKNNSIFLIILSFYHIAMVISPSLLVDLQFRLE